MRKSHFILSLILLCCTSIANAQFNNNQKEFVKSFLNEMRKEKHPILYLPNNNDKELQDVLKPDTLIDMWLFAGRNNPKNTLVLTQKEKKHIQKKLRQLRELKWSDHLLPNARLLSRDTVDYYLKDRFYGWSNLYSKGISSFYKFSNPIFLRKGTLCIFQYNYSCGSLCGQGTIMIYRKENGQWKPFINLANWIS